MKKLFLLTILLLVTASLAFGANFTPPVMKLSIPASIIYQFDGSNLNIPVSVSGSPGTGMFLVYTNGKASSIGPMKNGHLGWHYVNKIDTCLYLSGAIDLKVGSNTYAWNGKNMYGAALPKGDYTYYMFAYDNKSPKMLASQVYTLGYSYAVTIETKDAKGAVLANPIMYLGGNSKWRVGSDPVDISLKETTAYRGNFSRGTHIALDPADHAMVYAHESEGTNQYIVKYKWVPNGVAEIQTAWADKGIATLGACPDKYTVLTGAYSDGETIWASSAFPFAKSGTADLYFADIDDGSLKKRLDVSDWYLSLDDMNKGGQFNGGPDGIYFRNNILFTQGLEGCMVLAIDPYKESDSDKILWANDNGDYVHDHNFESTAKAPWMCNDFNTGPYTYSISADANNFLIFPAYDLGAVSFCLISGADGRGLGNFAYAGETADLKFTSQFLDEGTAWDGIYTDNSSTGATDVKGKSVWFIAHDSIKGIISSQVGVSESAPAAFSVAQNTPNPFNPSTTISFTLARSGKTVVEVYSVAGQKVATLVSANLSAGAHSVTWDAAKFSAGVYFYTVRSGDFSKTMKMTLLK